MGMLNGLNFKMSQFKEQKRIIEEEIRRGVQASRASLISCEDGENNEMIGNYNEENNSDNEMSEMLTIQDYQSKMGSRLATEAPPTQREKISAN